MPWADELEHQLSWLPLSGCEQSAEVCNFGTRLPETAGKDHPRLRLKFEVARQASSPSLCDSVRAVPWAHKAEQKLSRLDFSGCELSADIHIFRAGLPEAPALTLNVTFEV